jgi:hypothetical protein
MTRSDPYELPAGMVTVGEAMQGFLTELEERCREGGTHGGQESVRGL